MEKKSEKETGFTLIEILMVMGIIALLAAIVIVAINPARQFAQARNSQRISNLNAILNAVGQNIADNKGIFECGAGEIPAVTTPIKSGGGGAGVEYDMAECIAPTYLPSLPFDPGDPNAYFTSFTDYNTGYTISRNEQNRIVVSAPYAMNQSELEEDLFVIR